MESVPRALRERLVPAALTAAGVALLGAGILQYGAAAGPSTANVPPTTPSFILPSLPPINGSPNPRPTPDAKRVATRVVIAELDIDLPVIAQPNPAYPSCNVAMYLQTAGLGQPGSGHSIYLYAHARDGMFGPLYERVTLRQGGGANSLKGMLVDVYTSDDQRFVYKISGIRPNVKPDTHFLDGPRAVKAETLWLQTSTGPDASDPKLQVVAVPVAVAPADHKAAHPKAHPITCS